MLEELIQNYGYWALGVGTFLEGETIMVLAGFAAHAGYLRLSWTILIGTVGAFFGDQLYYIVGRLWGRPLLAKRERWKPKIAKLHEWLERHQNWVIIGFRFVYGFRMITPIFIGSSRVSWVRFALLNLFGSAVWAILFGSGGYFFGHALESVLKNAQRYEAIVIVAGGTLFTFFWFVATFRRRKS